MKPSGVLSGLATVALVALCGLLFARAAGGAGAAGVLALQPVSSDPYSGPGTGQHRTEVEPDTFSFGSTIVSAFQVGRYYGGGAANIGWATSTDGGASWGNGFLPGITKVQSAGNPYDRASDPSVAYDARHSVWLITSLAVNATPSIHGAAVLVSRSTDGGLTWSNPVVVASFGSLDKEWIVCDNTATSPHYGRCYVQFDDASRGDRLFMTTSRDGGLHWGPKLPTANRANGIGGQPVVQPDGTVIVPVAQVPQTAILAFRSTNGGQSWSSTVTVAGVNNHFVAGSLRTSPLPSAETDAAGNVYVVWQDCRFEAFCQANDIVMSTSTQGLTWSPVVRIPIDPVGSGLDHFIPGLAVDSATSGGAAHLGLTYYYYSQANCLPADCQLSVGFVSSVNGGATWSAQAQLAGPMNLPWLALTNQGSMVGDYISTSIASDGTAHPVFAVANAPSGTLLDEAMYSTGLAVTGGPLAATASGAQAAPQTAPASPPPTYR